VTIVARIPGEPVAQGRPRAFRTPAGFIRMYDPPASKNWKAMAHGHLEQAMHACGMARPMAGPVRCDIVAVFTCPRSQWLKTRPRPRRPHVSRPDAENVAKIVLDAAEGVVFGNDSQVADLHVRKVIGAQGEAPYVLVTVTAVHVPEPDHKAVAATTEQQPEQVRLI
jgi:Holliday junction resolvase RusA-like endonuclease